MARPVPVPIPYPTPTPPPSAESFFSTPRRMDIFPLFALSELVNGGPPLGGAEPGQRLELAVAKLDVGGPDHPGLEAQRLAQLGVDAGRRVVAHGEVVPVGVAHLVDRQGLGQGEDAPVGDAADDAAVGEDKGADGVGDPRERRRNGGLSASGTRASNLVSLSNGEHVGAKGLGDEIRIGLRERVLFYLDEVARTDLFTQVLAFEGDGGICFDVCFRGGGTGMLPKDGRNGGECN